MPGSQYLRSVLASHSAGIDGKHKDETQQTQRRDTTRLRLVGCIDGVSSFGFAASGKAAELSYLWLRRAARVVCAKAATRCQFHTSHIERVRTLTHQGSHHHTSR